MLRCAALSLSALFLFTACSKGPSAPATLVVTPAGDLPTGQLPDDVRPLRYALELKIVPEQTSFAGSARIQVQLDTPKQEIWIHGQGLNVAQASVRSRGETIPATWTEHGEDGVALLHFERPVDAGELTLLIDYTADFDEQLKGLYRVESGGAAYAFTQFEAISARLAFPCFDEPRFKTPFDIALTVKADHEAAGNTPVLEEKAVEGGFKRVRYRRTTPLPTYLIAWAVGPLEVVKAPSIAGNSLRKRPIPFRGLAVKGQGAKLAYALRHTPPMVDFLERYFGIAYPYAKLDIVAVPDFGSGAMENVGLITFREWLLLVDEKNSTEEQRRYFAYVMAHELAHQWFGNLVTMPWWDDIWLNEAFATWMGNKAILELYPEYHIELSSMEGVQRAMDLDSLSSARRIRQPIESNHDIRNAFDPITYQKGGAVLSMFERWLGFETFRDGLRRYIREHKHGSATADDLLRALDRASGKNVSEPFRTFLDQPGLPQLTTRLSCTGKQGTLDITQARYAPLGAKTNPAASWQLPVCVQTDQNSACGLIRNPSDALKLDHCPAWYMPNDEAAGYLRFRMPKADMRQLRSAFRKLSPRERIAVVDSLFAGFHDGTLKTEDVFSWFEELAADPLRQVATAPMTLIAFAEEHVADNALRKKIHRYGRALYRPLAERLGWTPKPDEDGETRILRETVLGFLALTVDDPAVRQRAAELGRAYLGYGTDGAVHTTAVDPQLAGLALMVAVQQSEVRFVKHVEQTLFKSQDATLRNDLLQALGSAKRSGLAQHARELVLDKRVRVNEIRRLLGPQAKQRLTRRETWTWLKRNYQPLVDRVGARQVGLLPWTFGSFCSEADAKAVQAFFGPRVAELSGGPRNLAGALEAIQVCAARVDHHRAGVERFFAR